jgi:hypothetical protein
MDYGSTSGHWQEVPVATGRNMKCRRWVEFWLGPRSFRVLRVAFGTQGIGLAAVCSMLPAGLWSTVSRQQ